jgi:hypothetical protein
MYFHFPYLVCFAVLRSLYLAYWWNLDKRKELVDCVLHIVLKSIFFKNKLIIENLGGT